MSVKAMSWAFGMNIEPVKKIILLSLADCADDNGRCFPGYALLAEKSSVSTKTVQRNVDKLEELGLVVKVNRKKGKRYTSNEYQLQLGVTEPTKPNDGMDTKSIGIDKESIPEEPPEKNLPMDRESTGMDSKCPEVWTPGVHIIVTEPSGNPDSDADAHEADALDGDFEVGEPEQQNSLPDDDHDPEVQPGIFGSHLLRDCHPYLYWFLRDMESRAARNPEALGDFAERLVMFGLQGSYCQASLNNFLRARKVCLDNQLVSRAREDGFESLANDLIDSWPGREAEYIAEADDCLADFREHLANQAA